MFEGMNVEKEYKLLKPYYEYSQLELVAEIWNHKGLEDIKIVIEHNGKNYELSTTGLNGVLDFLNKYEQVFKELGIPYDTNLNLEVVTDNSVNEQVIEEKGTNTPLENNPSFIEIKISDSSSLQTYFIRMMNKKSEINQEVKLVLNNMEINTVDCNNINDMLVKYSDLIFKEYEQYQTNSLNNKSVNDAVWLFKTPRGNRYDGSEENREEIVSKISEKTREYQLLFSKKDQIDFNNPNEVFNWIVSLTPYINNHALTLPVGVENSEYRSQDKLLIAILNKNGYTSGKKDVHNINDFYNQQIANQIEQLEKYGFFITEYTDMKEEDLSLTTKVVKEEAKLLRYKDRLDYCENKLEELNEYELGNIRTKGGNFNNQIQRLTTEIESLKNNKITEENMQQFSSNIQQVYNIIEKAILDKTLNENEVKIGRAYLNAYSLPTYENILEAFELAQTLSDESILKINLIDGISNLARRYSSKMDEDEIETINSKFESIGVTLIPKSNQDEIIKAKEIELNKIKTIKENRLNNGKSFREKIQNEINMLSAKVEELENKINKVEVKEEQEEVIEEEKPFFENSKLSELAEEGNIFTDSSNIDESHSYLNSDNAKNLGYINNDTEEYSSLVLTEEEIKKDSLFNFTVVKTVKKISKNLYDKISNSQVKEKIQEKFEAMKKFILPTVAYVGLPILAGTSIVAASPAFEQKEDDNQNEKHFESNNEIGDLEEDIKNTIEENNSDVEVSFTDNNQNQVAETNPTFEEMSQKVIDNALTGESAVYTNAVDASQGINAVEETKLYTPSWKNATPSSYYTVENQQAENISKEEAIEKYNNGESIIQKVENDGVGIGYIELNQNESGLTK